MRRCSNAATKLRGLSRWESCAALLLRVTLSPDIGDAYHVGGAGDAERHAGDDDHALAGIGEAAAEGNRAGAIDHVVLAVWVFRHHAMHPRPARQFAARRQLRCDGDNRRPRPPRPGTATARATRG